jgi:hypothetical protein
MSRARSFLVTAFLLVTVLATGFVSVVPGAVARAPAAGAATAPACHRPPPTAPAGLAAVTPYQGAVAAAGQRGMQVWLEADLLKRWWQGDASFQAGVQRLVALAKDPSVVGFKIADELGYGDVVQREPACMRRFVSDAVRALHQASPRSQVLVDLVVPDLGCVPGDRAVAAWTTRCTIENDGKYPALSLDNVDALLSMRALDVVDVSTGILDDSVYRTWGTDALHAQQSAWAEIARRHWKRDVVVNARKALAHPGAYPGTPSSADSSTVLFVDTPLQRGARAVDVWTWRQPYEGSVYRLADPGLQGNALWANLVARRSRGDLLFTHFSPSSVEGGVGADLDMISQAFGGVFVATGTG